MCSDSHYCTGVLAHGFLTTLTAQSCISAGFAQHTSAPVLLGYCSVSVLSRCAKQRLCKDMNNQDISWIHLHHLQECHHPCQQASPLEVALRWFLLDSVFPVTMLFFAPLHVLQKATVQKETSSGKNTHLDPKFSTSYFFCTSCIQGTGCEPGIIFFFHSSPHHLGSLRLPCLLNTSLSR